MSTNKHAVIRYKTLDKCFQNKFRKYFIDDLIEVCGNAITDHTGLATSVSRRQIFDDINFMKSEAGYAAPIESYREGRKTYYRYEDLDFSIEKSEINEEEKALLKNALVVFQRIQGLPNMEWLNELSTKLDNSLFHQENSIISYDHNPFLHGLEYLQELYQYILNKSVIKISYQSYRAEEPIDIIMHPYHLKQFNSRWFLFGWNHDRQSLQNLALDRMKGIELEHIAFYQESIDFEEYFEDIIGVTDNPEQAVEKVELEAESSLLPYILSKPIHGSQKVNGNRITLQVKLNYELEALLLSHGEKIKVLAPKVLKEKMKGRIENLRNLY